MANRRADGLCGHNLDPYSDEYYTPDYIPAALGHFDLDPAAGPKSHATVNIRLPQDGLKIAWGGRVWLNPPYLDIEPWLEKFARHGNGICLVNVRCETRWFQELIASASLALFLRGRIKFTRPNGQVATNPPTGSVLVAYGQTNAEALAGSGLKGMYLTPVMRLL